MKKFNINEHVKVKLTERGLEVYKKHYEKFGIKAPAKEAKDGYYRFQLWELMQIFGGSVGAGVKLPFETDIYFDDKDLVDAEEDASKVGV